MAKNYILNAAQSTLKIKRMALEILEHNVNAQPIILAGIAPNGTIIARQLLELLQPHFNQPVQFLEITLDKRHPVDVVVEPSAEIDGKTVLVVDDVANSGKTLTYALKPFLDAHPSSIQTLVLVDRTHKKFPIQPDFVGLSLASTIQEYIDVEVMDGEIVGAWME